LLSSRRRHTRFSRDWSSDVCSSDLDPVLICLGMVSERGDELYVEVPFPVEKCTTFVHETVLPLLGQEPAAFIPLEALRSHVLCRSEERRVGKEYRSRGPT